MAYSTETLKKISLYEAYAYIENDINLDVLVGKYENSEKIQHLDRYHHLNSHGEPTGVYDIRIFECICETNNLFILGGVPYFYDGGIYRPDFTGAKLKTKIRELIYDQFIKSGTIKRIYDLFLQAEELQVTADEINNFPVEWVCFKNGFYNPVDNSMVELSPTYRAVNQIPHEFHPEDNPSGENIENWFSHIFKTDKQREMVLQYAGLCMNRDTRQQKFLVLKGSGGTGKSTLIHLIENAVGVENISNISLSELTQRFGCFALMGKLMNSCADLEVKALEDVSTLKKILGEDILRAEQKGRDAVFFKSYAKLIFSANELPVINDERSNGFYRRLLIFNMNTIPVKKDMNFFNRINGEIDYFIKIVMSELRRLYQQGYITETEDSVNSVQQLREDSDSVEAFLSERTVMSCSGKIQRVALFNSYDRYCSENQRRGLSRTNFYKSLRTKGYREVKYQGEIYIENIDFDNNHIKG